MSVHGRASRPRRIAAAAAVLSCLVGVPQGAGAGVPEAAPTEITIFNVSGLRGTLEPTNGYVRIPPDPVPSEERFGGLAYLAGYFEQRARTATNPPLLLTAGDAVGASPALSDLLDDEPMIDLMNMMGFDVDTLGNHNFDRGLAHLRGLAARARFPYVVANLVNRRGHAPNWTQESVIFERGGVQIGITGVTTPEIPRIVRRGALGDLRVLDPVSRTNAAVRRLRAQGADAVVVLAHIGAHNIEGTATGGPLLELAPRLRGVDVLIGDHTHAQVDQPVVAADGKTMLVVQNLSRGVSFTEIKLQVDPVSGVVAAAADFQLASTRGAEPDRDIQRYITSLRDRLQPLLRQEVALSEIPVPYSILYLSEMNLGNLVTDAMRAQYGTDFAFLNSGALRGNLTRSDDRDEAGNYVIRTEYIYDTLPFGSNVTTAEITGSELKEILENGVSRMPKPDARFIQVSGLEFTYRSTATAGDRVVEVRYPDGKSVDLGSAARYTVALTDFMAEGGDDYPRLLGRSLTRAALIEVVSKYLIREAVISPPGPVAPAPAPETRIFHRNP
jgi:2',3'-cyclic-nucleotide 2'-phosphodiesterase (5'-nucleotidase family)